MVDVVYSALKLAIGSERSICAGVGGFSFSGIVRKEASIA